MAARHDVGLQDATCGNHNRSFVDAFAGDDIYVSAIHVMEHHIPAFYGHIDRYSIECVQQFSNALARIWLVSSMISTL